MVKKVPTTVKINKKKVNFRFSISLPTEQEVEPQLLQPPMETCDYDPMLSGLDEHQEDDILTCLNNTINLEETDLFQQESGLFDLNFMGTNFLAPQSIFL